MPELKNIQYLYPDKDKIKHEIKIKFKEDFLKLNNLKIGDEVYLKFPYHRIYKEPRKPEQRITWYKDMEGVLKEDDNGYLYAESLESMSFYKLNNEKKKDFYEHYYKKSIHSFDIGFI